MHLRSKISIFLLAALALSAGASDLKEVLPITNKIILLHFDDGKVSYPNALSVLRLNISQADNEKSYLLTSVNDIETGLGMVPASTGRKSKGTEFVKDPVWGGNSSDPRNKPWASEHFVYLVFNKALRPGKTYTLHTGSLAKNDSLFTFTFEEKNLRSETIHVNTLGYNAHAPKYGYLYQWMGDLGNLDLSAYAGMTFSLYKEGVLAPVKTGLVVKRKIATNAETGQSNDTPNKNFLGAEVYECDFSEVTADGTYRLSVEGMGCSYPFKIGTDAVFDAYYHTMRALYHQRSGIRLAPPYTASDYIRPVNQNTLMISDDGTSFAGKLLYSDYPYWDWANSDGGGSSQADIRNAAIGKNLDAAGWYHDAGDWDQYITHDRIPPLLMLLWEAFPERFGDDELNLPESGNGIPDILDEASWLIKFNYRLRKELLKKGYSDGGLGGARICADVFTDVDGSSEGTLPSWKEKRRTIVTKADAFMTYLYSGQAAQFAYILKGLGKDAVHFPVEMLDSVEFSKMSKDTVNWISEAEEAFAWASAPANQPLKSTNYPEALTTYRMYAAVNLYRLTGKKEFHDIAKALLNTVRSSSSLREDERLGVYSYLLSSQLDADKNLQSGLKSLAVNAAVSQATDAADKRACRWGGNWNFPMLVGQGSTPWMFEAIFAYRFTADKKFADVVHTTADYFLGCNPLHSTWMTGVGPRPASCGFHLDSRYNHNWVLYPGFIPYGPWSMQYDYTPYTWVIDGVSMQGGHGSWNKDWANFSMYPVMAQWPGHERWNSNTHAPMTSENTIHQNTVYGGMTYGFVNERMHSNSNATRPIFSLTLDQTELQLDSAGQTAVLNATPDIANGSFAALRWSSADKRIADVDGYGRVTALLPGTTEIQCTTLDGSVSASCAVNCSWLATEVDSIKISQDSLSLIQGQGITLDVSFFPENASNQYMNWSYSIEGVVSVDEYNNLTAVSPGFTVLYGHSLSNDKTDSCVVFVKESSDYVVADFDLVIPVTTGPQGGIAQLFTPNGTNDIAANNPLKNTANASNKVVRWNRPAGNWLLIGMVLDTLAPQDLSSYLQFQFKYYGKQVKDLWLQFIDVHGAQFEVSTTVEGEDCWKLFTCNLNSGMLLRQVNIFINPTVNNAFTCYMDDFKLLTKAAVATTGLALSEASISLNRGATAVLTVNKPLAPFNWISLNPTVASVDQQGRVSALTVGSTDIRAVPLLGTAAVCKVKVASIAPPTQNKTILDFENYELNYSAGYGAYAWNTPSVLRTDNPDQNSRNNSLKVARWDKDGSDPQAGFALVFPVEPTFGQEWISLLVHANQAITSLRMELYDGDQLIGFFLKTGLTIPANQWTLVDFRLADLGAIDKSISKIILSPEPGNSSALQIYTDDIILGKGKIIIQSIDKTSAASLRCFPNPADLFSDIDLASEISHVQLLDILGNCLLEKETSGTAKLRLHTSSFSAGIYFLKATGTSGAIFSQKLLIRHN